MLCLVTTKPSDAKFLQQHYNLKYVETKAGMPIYLGDSLALICCTKNHYQCACAVAFLSEFIKAQKSGIKHTAWLLIGRNDFIEDFDEVILAHSIKNSLTGKVWFPSICFRASCSTCSVATNFQGAKNQIRDEVSASFFEIASKVSLVDLVHLIFINSVDEEIKESILFVIDKTVESLLFLLAEISYDEDWKDLEEAFCKKMRFSQTQRCQLREALHKFSILKARNFLEETLESSSSSKEVLATLNFGPQHLAEYV